MDPHKILESLFDNFPYYLLGVSFVYSMVYCRSTRLKVLPSCTSFFCRLIMCYAFSILIKYPFSGERPENKEYSIPKGWMKVSNLPAVSRTKRILIAPEYYNKYLEKQPLREVHNLPLSLSKIKARYGPCSGTPSSHGIVSGYLFSKVILIKNIFFRLTGIIITLTMTLSRVFYKYHYPYQVLIGTIIGALIGQVSYYIM
ncbi:hypothetical protein NEOKW01_0846 [Nematocida sp. AWRm80]|nr:hypothetical protein NEOKW01_0846 [Nematocida sp. AWRm80]